MSLKLHGKEDKDSIKEIFSASACCWEEKPPVKEFVAFVSDNLAFENIA